MNKFLKQLLLFLTVSSLLNAQDTEPPVITLIGEPVMYLNAGDPYIEQGATAVDNIDGDITSSIVIIDLVDVNTVGTYTVTYNVSDAAGNMASPVKSIIFN